MQDDLSVRLRSPKAGSPAAAIARFVTQARCICVLEGFSPGLAWELEYLRHHAEPIKLLFLTHPENIGRRRVCAAEFWRAVQDVG